MPSETPAPPTEPLDEEAQAAPPAPQPELEAPAPPDPASSGDGDPQRSVPVEEPEQAPPASANAHREALIAKLTGEDEPPEPEAPEAPPEPEAPEAPQAKAPEAPPAPAPVADPDLVELTNETAKVLHPGEYRRKVNKLISRVKAAEPDAQGFREIVKLCQDNQMSPDDYRAWVNLGVGLQQGNPQAIKLYGDLRAKLGIQDPAPPAPEPVSPLTPDLDAFLKDQTAAGEMTESVAQALRQRLTPAPAKPAAPPAQPPAKPAAPPAPPPPAVDPMVEARQRAVAEMDRIAAAFEKRIGVDAFKELEARVAAELSTRRGRHPDAWPDIYRAALEACLARAPRPRVPAPPLRPGRQPTPHEPAYATERERVVAKYTT